MVVLLVLFGARPRLLFMLMVVRLFMVCMCYFLLSVCPS